MLNLSLEELHDESFGKHYLTTTPPSFYDLSRHWSLRKTEYECAAKLITRYCLAHGDRWQKVPISFLEEQPYFFWPREAFTRMPEIWLEFLQPYRKPMPGPALLIQNPKARGGFQLVHPNGVVEAASFAYTDEQMASFASAEIGLQDLQASR